jgi:catechol 2,3-dioxygenase-like lactoylglutathione lyase family enzyme
MRAGPAQEQGRATVCRGAYVPRMTDAAPRRHLAHVALVVPDYDAAIDWFTTVLDFTLVEDTPMGPGKRWVLVRPAGAGAQGANLLLARAKDDTQRAVVGRQGAGRVLFFLATDDFARDHARFRARGVEFVEAPREESYGTVAVFRDLFGNLWDLVQYRSPG